MIAEDYCNFEIAKLLKKKGFNEPCLYNYWDDDNLMMSASGLPTTNDSYIGNRCSAPTLQMAMKWLRAEHNIFFNINYFHLDVGNKWLCLTIWLPYKNGCELSIEGFDIETVYEDAIKYCLENLI